MPKFGKKNANEKVKSQYEKELEEKGPNVSSYEDDPLLNMEPVFADDLSGQMENKQIQKTFASAPVLDDNPLKGIIEKHREQAPLPEPKRDFGGPLGDIIGNARKKAESIAHDVEERDPVIAKLKKIDELMRSGGSDESLYTDVNKSHVGYYAQRAKDFLDQQVTKKPESDAERIARMAKETRERGVNNYVPNTSDMTEEIKSKIEAVRHKERNNLVEDDFRARAKEVLESAMVTAKTPQNNVEEEDARTRARELLAASTVVTKTPQPRNDLGIFAVDNNSVFGVKAAEDYQIEKRLRDQQERVNVSEIVKELDSDNLTEEKIKELEEKIKKKIEKVQKHKIALAKKEEKVMKLVFETEAKKSSTKIAQLLEQRTIELEMESKQLQEHEDNLEKTIADLKAINVKPKTKTKKPNEK
jgi:hypothetical protein